MVAVPSGVQYPDLQPPPRWNHFRQGLQVRLIPPEARPEDAPASIVVSPLVPRLPHLLPIDKLVEAAIFAESRQRFEVLSQKGPQKAKAEAGLTGVIYEIHGYPRPQFPREKRIYVMYADEVCYYGLSYLAAEAAYDAHLQTFWAVAGSVRPYQGRLVVAQGASPLGAMYQE
jgi:hypothetical protein